MDTNLSCGLFTVLIIFLLALYAYHTIYGKSSFVRSLTRTTQNGVIRGALLGYLSGGYQSAINNAALWGVTNGAIAGISEYLSLDNESQ